MEHRPCTHNKYPGSIWLIPALLLSAGIANASSFDNGVPADEALAQAPALLPPAAELIDFESDAPGAKANGFQSVDSANATFTDSLGADLCVEDFGSQSDGQALAGLWDDQGFLIIDFAVPMRSISLDFGNDDPCCSNPGDEAEIRAFLDANPVGSSQVVMNRNDIMDQTITFSDACFDQVEFQYVVTTSGLIEVVDNIVFEECEFLEKEIVGGTDLNEDGVPDLAVEVGILTPSMYDFKLTYSGPDNVLIQDAIPAEWDVMIPDAVVSGDTIPNGNFETGDFTSWSQINAGSGGIVVDDGTFDPLGPGGPVAPFEGSYGSATWQGGPGIHTLYQDVDVPEYGMPTLVWADHIQNWAADYSVPNQQWRVEVWDPSDNSVMAILRETLPGDPLLQDWTVYTADLSPWAGQTVRIAFTEQDNQFFFNARLDAVDVVNDPNQLNCVLTHANGKGGSATLADCLTEGAGMTWFWTMARCHDNRKNAKCRPTSCGALYLNHGAEAYEEWEGPNKKGQLSGIGDPFLVSNSLCLAAVEDINGGGIDYTGNGDEDEDGIPDWAEACEGVTDVCNPDTDGDGVLDGADECPLEGPPNARIGEVQDPNGCNRQSQCSDGIDNEGDGPIDYPDDASCDSIVDDSEDTFDVFASGTFPVRGTFGFDLDLGAENPTPGAGTNDPPSDIWFRRVSATESEFSPVNGATQVLWGPAQPSAADCAGAALSGATISFFAMDPSAPSTWLCAMTDEGRLSAFRVFSGSADPDPIWNSQDIVIEFVTWP